MTTETVRPPQPETETDDTSDEGRTEPTQNFTLGRVDFNPDYFTTDDPPVEESVLLLQGLCYFVERDESIVFTMQYDPNDQYMKQVILRRLVGYSEFDENKHRAADSFEKYTDWIDGLNAEDSINTDQRILLDFQSALEDKLSGSFYTEFGQAITRTNPDMIEYHLIQLLEAFVTETVGFSIKLELTNEIQSVRPEDNGDSQTEPDESESSESTASITVTARCDPHDGKPVGLIEPEDDVIVQMVGDVVRGLPDALQKTETDQPKSIPFPMTIKDVTPAAPSNQLGENEYRLNGRLDNDTPVDCIVHQNDTLKTPQPPDNADQPSEAYDMTDHLELAILVSLIVLIGVLIGVL